MQLKRRMSYSMLNQADCMKKLYFYMNRIPVAYGPAANRGTKLHKVLEEYNGEDDSPLELNYQELGVFEVARQKLVEISEHPGIKLGPEFRLELDKAGLPVVGVFDLMLNDGTIWDWKFPNAPWNDYKLKDYTDKQAWFYFWLLEEYQPERLKFYVVNFQDHQPQEFTVDVDWDRVKQELVSWQNLGSRIQAAEAMDMWDYEPTPNKCRWCNYNKICERAMV